MKREKRVPSAACWVLGAGAVVLGAVVLGAQRPNISDKPDTPFKLATFEAAGKTRLGLVLGTRVLDIAAANDSMTKAARLPPVRVPADMRELIENYDRLRPRLYQIANYYQTAEVDPTFPFGAESVSVKAPIKYPYNLLAIAANYKLHAGEMFPPGSPQQKAAEEADPDKEDPVFFAKSPRSCIIDPGDTYIMPPNRNIDWEGELAIIISRPAFNVTEAQSHDYVFG